MSGEEEQEQDKLHAALWLATGRMVDEICSTELKNVTPSTNFIAALTSYMAMQLETITQDAEAFAKHRGSNIIESQDVLLCTRRNQDLYETVKAALDADKTTKK